MTETATDLKGEDFGVPQLDKGGNLLLGLPLYNEQTTAKRAKISVQVSEGLEQEGESVDADNLRIGVLRVDAEDREHMGGFASLQESRVIM